MTFSNFSLSSELLSQIAASGYTTPTPIQEQAIPAVLSGQDIMGLAQTGTGKTAAFAIPIIQRLMKSGPGKLRVLIIAPTRELAEQINSEIVKLAQKTGLRSGTAYGGVKIKGQIAMLRHGVDILVACPGRLLDHIRQRNVRLGEIETLILDEADQMFDMGFLPSVREIIKSVPKQRQTLLFSATMPPDIKKLAQTILINPTTIEVGHTQAKESITHTFFPLPNHLKTALLMTIIKETATHSVLIFTRTKHRAEGLDEKLRRAGYKAASLQGNLTQNQRQNALNGFRDGKYDFMVATDIAARGIDISRVSHVINYDMPDTFEAYTHRIGRTGRAARTGDAYTLVVPEDHAMESEIRKKLGCPIETKKIESFNYDEKKPAGTGPEFPRGSRPSRSPFKKTKFGGRSNMPKSNVEKARSSRKKPPRSH